MTNGIGDRIIWSGWLCVLLQRNSVTTRASSGNKTYS